MPNAPRHAGRAVTALGPPVPIPTGGRPRAALGHFWYPRPPIWPSLLSAAVHVAVIAAIVWTVGDVMDRPKPDRESAVSFLPPPPQRAAPSAGDAEHVAAFMALTYSSGAGQKHGADSGSAARNVAGRSAPRAAPRSVAHATEVAAATDTASAPKDNVYTSFEVDNAVQFSAGSAVPKYPPELLARRVSGVVTVRFVVDTSGVVDASSVRIVDATDSQFVASVREALPQMKFQPARLNGKRVRQLVEQPFRFNIETSTTKRDDSAPNQSRDSTGVLTDNVYTSFQVDNVAQFATGSAVPRYPEDLLERQVSGVVTVRFIVDTSGLIDSKSVRIVNASEPQFVASVREALPRMKFQPARLNGKRVRQMVEQPFRFNAELTKPRSEDS